jgi:hypothetical protein
VVPSRQGLGVPVGARGPHRQPATDQTASSGGATGALRAVFLATQLSRSARRV